MVLYIISDKFKLKVFWLGVANKIHFGDCFRNHLVDKCLVCHSARILSWNVQPAWWKKLCRKFEVLRMEKQYLFQFPTFFWPKRYSSASSFHILCNICSGAIIHKCLKSLHCDSNTHRWYWYRIRETKKNDMWQSIHARFSLSLSKWLPLIRYMAVIV